MFQRILFCFWTIILVNLHATAQIDYRGFPEWSWHKVDSTEYFLYTPKQMEPGKKYPVALFMHGCCGDSYKASLRNAVDPPARMWHNFGSNTQTVPTYIIAPATSRGWSQHFGNLKKVIDDLIANEQADPQRIYVTGFSMGGEGTYKIIQKYPGFFAAAIPMGMSLRGDSTITKQIPIWTHQGETDWFARDLRKQVAAIRQLNGYAEDTGATWVTGINPRYSNFTGVGHGVQWIAASTQDLTGWAYSKINDGNLYPVIYFESPLYGTRVQPETSLEFTLNASDPDGIVHHIDIFQDDRKLMTLTKAPYRFSATIHQGDQHIRAIAVDDKGKTNEAVSLVSTDIRPVITDKNLQDSKAGEWYQQRIHAKGNGKLLFELVDNSTLPAGLKLYPEGVIRGIASTPGNYKFSMQLTDTDGQKSSAGFSLKVKTKTGPVVIVSNVHTLSGKAYPLRVLLKGSAPHFNSKDSILTTDTEEINFSETGKFDGFTLIQTDVNDADDSSNALLEFTVDEDVVVFVAYESINSPTKSTLPAWLQQFKDEKQEIVAQYRYYHVFSRAFPSGKVTLPGANAKGNGVGSNYFVFVKKR